MNRYFVVSAQNRVGTCLSWSFENLELASLRFHSVTLSPLFQNVGFEVEYPVEL